MIRDLGVLVTLEELELLTDIRDFTTLFYVILRRESSEWLESSIESDLDMRIAIWSLHLAFHDFAFFDTLSSVRTGQLKNLLLAYIRDPLFFPFVNRAKDPLYSPLDFSLCFHLALEWKRNLCGM